MPVAPADSEIARIAVRYLLRNASPRNLYIITPRRRFRRFVKLQKEAPGIRLMDGDSLIPGVDLESIRQFLLARGADPRRAGWYYQQFLKMAACHLPGIADHYLIWDSDTILLRPTAFFGHDGKVLVTPESECHAPYFETYCNVLGRQPSAGFSFVAGHFMVRKEFMKELLAAIAAHSASDDGWVWNIMRAIGEEHLSRSGFSEYETYGNFVTSAHPETIECRPLSAWRWGARQFGTSPNRFDLHRLSLKYSYASFERWDRGKGYRITVEKAYSIFVYWLNHLTNRSG